jgi:hypothetical protein
MINPGEEIHGNGGQRMRVLAVVPFDEEDGSPFVGLYRWTSPKSSGAATPCACRCGSAQRRPWALRVWFLRWSSRTR